MAGREVNGVEISDGGVSKGSTLKPDKIEDSSNIAGRWRQAHKKNLCVCWLGRDGWTGFFQFVFPN